MAFTRARMRNDMAIQHLEFVDITMSNTAESEAETTGNMNRASMRPGPIVKNLSHFKNYSKVRASQKLSLKQKVKFWNMSMPQWKTGPSGTQPKWKPSTSGLVADLTHPGMASMIGPRLPDPESATSSGALTSSFAIQSFGIDQKSKDKCSNMFSKFASPAVPISKPGGKQNWSWETLDETPGSGAGEIARDTGTTIAVFSPKKATIPDALGIISGSGRATTGGMPSLFGPELEVGTYQATQNGLDAMFITQEGESSSGSGALPSIFGPRKEVGSDRGAFSKFGTFPKEIRDMIWDHSFRALPPQAIVISVDLAEMKKIREARPSYDKSKVFRAKATCHLAAIFHTCRESRMSGMKRYKLAFREQLNGRTVLFDYEKDALLFESKAAFVHFYGGTLVGGGPAALGFPYDMNEIHRNVRHLAIAGQNNSYTTGVNTMGWTLNLWTGLGLLVLSSEYSDWSHLQRTFLQRMNALIDGRSKPPGVWSELTTRRYTVDLPEICYKGKGAQLPAVLSFDKVSDKLKSRRFVVKARTGIAP